MVIIAGLGNPGPGYAGHRHNVGFMLLDAIVEQHGFCLLYTSDAADDA